MTTATAKRAKLIPIQVQKTEPPLPQSTSTESYDSPVISANALSPLSIASTPSQRPSIPSAILIDALKNATFTTFIPSATIARTCSYFTAITAIILDINGNLV